MFSCYIQSRGSTRDGTGVHDSIVNQLLTKVSSEVLLLFLILQIIATFFFANINARTLFAFQIDGVESLNNVLLIGMTNRKDLLDEALLRSLSLPPSLVSFNCVHATSYCLVSWKLRSPSHVTRTMLLLKIYFIYVFLVYRPGRLEVQIEISLPDENGRIQILQIHTNKMKENSFLAPDVNLEELGMCISDICFWDLPIHLLFGPSDH